VVCFVREGIASSQMMFMKMFQEVQHLRRSVSDCCCK
jgi:hypothetical protein